jgi:predicted HTH domain antitoxin
MYELKEEKSLKLYDLKQAASILNIDLKAMDHLVATRKIIYLTLDCKVLIPRQFLFEYIKKGLKYVQDRIDERKKIEKLFLEHGGEVINQNYENNNPIDEENNEPDNEKIDADNSYNEEESNQDLNQIRNLEDVECL